MSQTLKIVNFSERNIVDQTQLSNIATAGAMSLPVLNTNDFTTGFTLVGSIGDKNTEMVASSNPITSTIIPLVTAISITHPQYDLVYSLFGNKIRIYRATNVNGMQPVDSSFGLLDTIDIDANDSETSYNDLNGGGNYWYKSTYFNSQTSSETDLASSIAIRGSFTVNYCSIDDIRQEAGFKLAPYVADSTIDQKRQAAQDTINGQLDEFYATPFQPPIPDSLKQICIVLAAGYLRQAQYSQISNPQVNGTAKVKWAENELRKLSMKERVLVAKDGHALDGPGASGGVNGWPNASTAVSPGNQGGAPRVFRMADIQGQPFTVDSSGNPVGNLYYGRRW